MGNNYIYKPSFTPFEFTFYFSVRRSPAFSPTPLYGSTKYGPTGLFSMHSFPHLSDNADLCSLLSNLANHSLAKSTWSTYSTAYKMLLQCFNNDVSFLLSKMSVITFVGWLSNRNLAVSTINSYLAGLRQVHLTLGHDIPHLRSDIINQILTGKKNLDSSKPRTKPVRIPVTPTMLRILKSAINKDDLPFLEKRLFWFLCVLAFHGAFRIGELLTCKPNLFDPNYTLLNKHVQLNTTNINGETIPFLEVTLNSSKCSLTPTVIDVYPTGSDICPVRAYSKLTLLRPDQPLLPAFRLALYLTARGFLSRL